MNQKLKENESERQFLSRIRAELKEGILDIGYINLSLEDVKKFLSSEDAKVRKNILLLIYDIYSRKNKSLILKDKEKALCDENKVESQNKDKLRDIIFSFYKNETVLFVKPYYPKALMTFNIEDIRDELKKIFDGFNKKVIEASEKKHVDEEKHNLSLLLDEKKSHIVKSFKKAFQILLTMNPIILSEIKEENKSIYFDKIFMDNAKITKWGIRTTLYSIKEIEKNHLYKEMLFLIPIKKDFILSYDTMKDFFKKTAAYKILNEIFETENEIFKFRLELRGESSKELIKKAAKQIELSSNQKLINSPSDYEFTFVFRKKEDGTFSPFILLPKYTDERFLYRKNIFPNSMTGNVAAEYIYVIRNYIKKENRVIDAFSGSGTLLIERARLKTRENYGIDTYGEAVIKGRENARLAKVEINFVNRNYFDFTSSHGFEEILCEFPDFYGKDFIEKESFYNAFFKKSSELSEKGTYMFLISNEDNLIKKNIRLNKNLSLVEIKDIGYEKKIFIIIYKN